MIDCPKCGGGAKVYNGIADADELRYIRRRRCEVCDYRFITIEVIADTAIQGDGTPGGSRRACSPEIPEGGERLFTKRKEEKTLRTCEVDGSKAFFHQWVQQENAILVAEHFTRPEDLQRIGKSSLESGIVPKGFKLQTCQHTFALIEYINGEVEKVNPERVRFTDR